MNNEFENENYTAYEQSEEENFEPEFTVTHRNIKKGHSKIVKVIALSLVAGIVAGSAFGFANSLATKLTYSKMSIGTTKLQLSENKTEETSDIAKITEECMGAIVAITNRSVSDVMTFFGTYSQESTSSGSGIIIGKNDNELLIVTNYHVVANSKELSVIFSSVEDSLEEKSSQGISPDGSEDIPTAIVKGYDADKDLAVIAVPLKDISAELLSQIKIATIGDSSALKAGDRVVAIGNALGYGQSVTTGIVSAVNRRITADSSDAASTNTFIQTDAAINFGNSGGALLNMRGEVVGINSAKITASGVEGMGYAIPISDVQDIIDNLMVKKTRDVVDEDKQGFLGITGRDVSSSISSSFGLPVGVYVESVTENLAADKAGIKKGYIITEFDGYKITAITQLQERLTYYKSGEEVELKVKVPAGESGYKEKSLTVKLSNKAKNANKVQ